MAAAAELRSAAELPPIVLVVEDDDDTRQMYESGLCQAGIWVDSVALPDDAFDHAIELRPDAVLLDVGLPEVEDGMALAHAIRQDARLATTPILAVTGHGPAKLAASYPVFSRVLLKPVDLGDIIRELRSLSSRHITLRRRYEEALARTPRVLSRAAEVQRESARLRAQSVERRAGEASRACPRCHKPLRFAEQRTLDGVTYDYYLACQKGCGLFCWDQSQRKMIALIE